MNLSRFRKWFYYLPLCFWMFVIFMASTRTGSNDSTHSPIESLLDWLIPGILEELSPQSLEIISHHFRKTAHVTEYAILTLLAIRAIRFGAPALTLRQAFWAGVGVLVYACSDEFHQYFVPGRTSSIADVGIDGIGAVLVLTGIGMVWLYRALEKALWKSVPSSH